MNNIVTREDILREKTQDIEEGTLLLKLFEIAEQTEIGEEIELQNKFTLAALEVLEEALRECSFINLDNSYKAVKNIYYVVELYLKGYYDNESYMKLEEFLLLVKENKARQVIEEAGKVFETRINRLKRIISKSKKKIPWENRNYRETKNLLEQIDSDLRYCLNYPTTPANLSDFYFGSYHELAKPVNISKPSGIIALEENVYGLYEELRILSKLDVKVIDKICKKYAECVGTGVPYNLFERVINNYLFAIPYSETPEDLEISKVDASLLVNEIKRGTLNSTELIDSFISRYDFKEKDIEYLKKYGEYLQKSLDSLKDSNYFGELFVVTKPK